MADPEIHPGEPTSDELRNEIKEILCEADLAELTSKKVRSKLADTFKCDLTERFVNAPINSLLVDIRKREIDDILMEEISAKQKTEAQRKPEAREANGSAHAEHSDDDEGDESDDSGPADIHLRPSGSTLSAVSRKRNRRPSPDITDEELARQLLQRDRGTRASNRRPVKVEKVKKPRKTPNSTGVPRNSGYSKHLLLSDALSSLVGADKVICEFHSIAIDAQLARHDVVKRVWAIIKEKNMYDPKNRQFVICDEAFTKVFKVPKFKAFGMMKYLKNHMREPDLITEPPSADGD